MYALYPSNLSLSYVSVWVLNDQLLIHYRIILGFPSKTTSRNSYTMGCPHVRGDNPRALASGLSYVQVDNPWYNYFIPPTSVYTLHITRYSMLKLVRVV